MKKFPRSHRLFKALEFKQVWRQAKRCSTPYITIFACPNQLGYPRLGLSIAKRNIRNATDRNRLKRLARETFRHKQALLGGHDIVIVVYKGADALKATEQFDYFQQAWSRFEKLKSRKNA
ncbi:MAG: ribonuclease P protein component [Gammaproteobacteria bacterium]